MMKMRSLVFTGLSLVLSSVVVGNAYMQKKQFYPSVVYITKSNSSMAVLYLQAFVFVVLMGKLCRKIFFGQLRAAETEHLIERSWYAVTETCLAFTVFRDDFSPRFVALFTLLLFLKCFHWLAEDRVDYMERSPVISWLFHIRAISLITVLFMLDLLFINYAYYSTLLKGASVQLVFGFEYAILLTVVFMTLTKYLLHCIDIQSNNNWENKAVYLLYSELVTGFIKVLLYTAFMIIMIKVHTFPLFAIRPMYLAVRGFKKALHDVIMSRRAIYNMNQYYPDATEEDLQSTDRVCIICREDMIRDSKKLPCNHIFHTNCLRSWFQRQQTCPTCRMDILHVPRPQTAAQQPPQQVQHQQQQPPPIIQNMFPGFPGMQMWPPAPPVPPPMAQQGGTQPGIPVPDDTQGAAARTTAVTDTTSTSTTTAPMAGIAPPVGVPYLGPGVTIPPMPQMFMPTYPVNMMSGFPHPPTNMAGLSDDELREMEGIERQNVEARIQWLRDIQSLLDGAMLLISQYNTVAVNMSMDSIRTETLSTAERARTSTEVPVPLTSPPQGGAWSKGGARSKFSSPQDKNIRKAQSASSLISDRNESKTDLTELEGATGYTSPKEEMIPAWNDPKDEEHSDEMDEVRRRRLHHFSSSSSLSSFSKQDDETINTESGFQN
ncbi:hypothetical protein CHS0354_013254 [Potamilus streckersoni]|uniref:RING-type E3 ubiquitin transferase n=1 Tax=Potamilus streckersoni TaxID=2493646 RepID=A0AAE0VYG9_9BIVA|nr:hypothetical protein CHS0354_013254 [Potamilus streckersoni]